MAQVDSENITAVPAVSTRRRFLSQAAAVTAGGTALATAAARAGQALDPILEAIEAHKAAHAKFVSWVDRHCKLENELTKERRCSSFTAWEEEIVETDVPRWIEAERQVDLTGDAEIEAAYALIEAIPTTRLGTP
jgi:hypothetical protein